MTDIRAVLFDLDGTLVDTAPDMANALNIMLQQHGLPSLPLAVIRPHVSHGANALVQLGFKVTPQEPGFEALRQEYLAHYASNLDQHSRTFAGMESVLAFLDSKQIPWGVVTNKPGYLTEPLLDALGLKARSACIVSGDTTVRRKPHPDPLLHACALLQHQPLHVLYIGDAERDVQAGTSAGMPTLVAMFGYLGDKDRPDTWGASALVTTPMEILDWINGNA